MPAPAPEAPTPDAPAHDAQDQGFITPVFAGLGLALALVGAAFVMAARQDVASARTASARQVEQLRLEGKATVAAFRLLDTPDQARRGWSEDDRTRLLAEPEGRKINPLFAERPGNLAVAARLVGPERAQGVVEALAREVAAAPRLVRRGQIAAISPDARWRACAASVFSAYSQQTALSLEPAAAAAGHVGEIWRIVVVGQDGAFVDQLVRFSADRARPFDILEQSAGHAGGAARIGCRRLIDGTES